MLNSPARMAGRRVKAARRVLDQSFAVSTIPARHFSSSRTVAAQPNSPQSSTSSIHASEISHFTRLSSTWWDPSGELALLHKMNRHRIEFLRKKIIESEGWDRTVRDERSADAAEEAGRNREWCKGKSVLDVGCGGGLLSESLARLGASVHGVDATGTNIAIAQTHASKDPFFSQPVPSSSSLSSTPSPRLQYTHTTAEDLLSSSSSQSESYDIVASVEVLEHVSSPASFLHSLNALLKPGGHLLISTIARTPLAQFLTITMAERILGLVSRGTHSYEKFIKPDELKDFICKPTNGGLGWYPLGPSATSLNSRVDFSAPPADALSSWDTFGPRSLLPPHLDIETRGIIYDPLRPGGGDWILLDRNGWLQRSGWGEECNYLLWARKPLVPGAGSK